MKYLITISVFLLLKRSTMALEIKTEIIINASPQKVWGVFSNFEKYPQWNSFIISLTGEVEENKKIKAVIQAPDSKPMAFKPKVLSLVENKELTWLGYLLFPGVFDGRHHFELNDNGDGSTFIQSERFKGVLVPFFKKSLNENTRKGFEMMNEQLKELAES